MIRLFGLLLLAHQVFAEKTECFYRAAALQYTPQTAPKISAQNYQELNLNNVIPYIKDAATQSTDIVVLPEGIFWLPGLDDIIDMNLTYAEKRATALSYAEYIPMNGTVPCDLAKQSFSITRELSCIARETGIFIVGNLLTIVECKNQPSCPIDGVFNFNTDIVLDRTGRLVGIYHKHNLYGTYPIINPAPTNEPPVTFWLSIAGETCASSVKIGVFICWDLEYNSPWNSTSLRELGVHDLAFSTDWGSYPPIAHAGTWQQGFAVANKVNLIAANNGASQFQPGIGPSGNGGGIFAAGKVLTQAYDLNKDLNVLLVADVPIKIEDKKSTFTYRRLGIAEERTSHQMRECEITSGPDLDGVTIKGTCDIITSPGHWQLSTKDDHIYCEAAFTITAGNGAALVAVYQNIDLADTPKPFKISSCLLIPCNTSGICPNVWPENSEFSNVTIYSKRNPDLGEYIWAFPMMVSTNDGVVSLVDINTDAGSNFTVSPNGLESLLVLDQFVASASIFGVRRS